MLSGIEVLCGGLAALHPGWVCCPGWVWSQCTSGVGKVASQMMHPGLNVFVASIRGVSHSNVASGSGLFAVGQFGDWLQLFLSCLLLPFNTFNFLAFDVHCIWDLFLVLSGVWWLCCIAHKNLRSAH